MSTEGTHKKPTLAEEPLVLGIFGLDDQYQPVCVYLPKHYHKEFKTKLLLGVKDFEFFIRKSFYDLDWMQVDSIPVPNIIFDTYVTKHYLDGRVVTFSVE